jgi:hypothetical protein
MWVRGIETAMATVDVVEKVIGLIRAHEIQEKWRNGTFQVLSTKKYKPLRGFRGEVTYSASFSETSPNHQ